LNSAAVGVARRNAAFAAKSHSAWPRGRHWARLQLGAGLAVTSSVNLPLAYPEDEGIEELFDFDDLDDLDAVPELDPLEIVRFRFLASSIGRDSFEERIALLVRLLDEYDETDDTFLPPARKVVPLADVRALAVRMLSLKAAEGSRSVQATLVGDASPG